MPKKGNCRDCHHKGGSLTSILKNRAVRGVVSDVAGKAASAAAQKGVTYLTGDSNLGRYAGQQTGKLTSALADEGLKEVSGAGGYGGLFRKRTLRRAIPKARKIVGLGLQDEGAYQLGGVLQSNGLQPWVSPHEKMAYVRSFRGYKPVGYHGGGYHGGSFRAI